MPSHVDQILKLKNKLLNPKRSDKFTLQYYLDGWRTCDVIIGNNRGTITARYGRKSHAKKMTMTKLKKEFNSLYWYAAKTDAVKKMWEEGNKKLSSNWMSDY